MRFRHCDLSLLTQMDECCGLPSGRPNALTHCDSRPLYDNDDSQSVDNRRAGVLMQIALGAVYAWSVFRIPLTRDYNRTVSE